MNKTDFFPDIQTPADVFLKGEYHDDELQCYTRDWYWVQRGTISMPTWHEGKLRRFQSILTVVDAASRAFLYYEKIPHGATPAVYIERALAAAMETHGRPTKGIVLTPSIWASFRDICASKLYHYVDVPSFACCGSDFEGMTLAARLEVQQWIRGHGLRCSFTALISRGDPEVTAVDTLGMEQPYEEN